MNTANQVSLHQSRGIERLVEGVATSDGAGVSLTAYSRASCNDASIPS